MFVQVAPHNLLLKRRKKVSTARVKGKEFIEGKVGVKGQAQHSTVKPKRADKH